MRLLYHLLILLVYTLILPFLIFNNNSCLYNHIMIHLEVHTYAHIIYTPKKKEVVDESGKNRILPMFPYFLLLFNSHRVMIDDEVSAYRIENTQNVTKRALMSNGSITLGVDDNVLSSGCGACGAGNYPLLDHPSLIEGMSYSHYFIKLDHSWGPGAHGFRRLTHEIELSHLTKLEQMCCSTYWSNRLHILIIVVCGS